MAQAGAADKLNAGERAKDGSGMHEVVILDTKPPTTASMATVPYTRGAAATQQLGTHEIESGGEQTAMHVKRASTAGDPHLDDLSTSFAVRAPSMARSRWENRLQKRAAARKPDPQRKLTREAPPAGSM